MPLPEPRAPFPRDRPLPSLPSVAGPLPSVVRPLPPVSRPVPSVSRACGSASAVSLFGRLPSARDRSLAAS
ncbi:hypothetical protein FH965_16265 [Streptomyces spectabilis]|uniref:Uncharacterized protein n=1 Tax=Streptomyces spectabilis TaxID=68270 RepID=A0A516R8G3_STRST|nr:hypothetical protein FH965_16265 [Streptomyces spectabilis]